MWTYHFSINDFEQLFFDQSVQTLPPKNFRLSEDNPGNSGISDHFPVAVNITR